MIREVKEATVTTLYQIGNINKEIEIKIEPSGNTGVEKNSN